MRERGRRNPRGVDEAGRWTANNSDYSADTEDYGENDGEDYGAAAAYSGGNAGLWG